MKQAIAWIREHAHEYGGDASFIMISGNSAGGHLSSLAALTTNEPAFQPGFEDADTTIQAAAPIYGSTTSAARCSTSCRAPNEITSAA